MRSIFGLAVSSLLMFATFAASASMVDAAEKPNILFLFADDMAYETSPGFESNPEVETPNLDRLRDKGFTFTNAYNMGGWHGAVCVASRTMLNTGRFLWHARNEEKSLVKEYQGKGRTWAQLLEKGGYDTYFTGKWHVRMDANKVFKVARHIRPGMPNQVPSGYNRPIEGKPDVWKPWDTKNEGFWKGGKHWSEVTADDAIDYLGMAEKSENPFFMYVAFNAPHDPRQAPKEYVDKYPPEKVKVPEPFYPEYPFEIGSNTIRDEKLAPLPRTKHAVQVNRAEYFAIITHLDAQIGRILEALEKTGKADNTYIVFTADHGLSCGRHGLMGKQNMFAQSVQVPFHVVGPDVEHHTWGEAPIYLQDVIPTTLQWAGLEVPEQIEFRSFAAHICNEEGKYPHSEPYGDGNLITMYGAYVDSQRMVDEGVGGHKLIVYPKLGKELLFDNLADGNEANDLAESADSKPVLERLRQQLVRWQRETGDTLDLTKTMPEYAAAAKAVDSE